MFPETFFATNLFGTLLVGKVDLKQIVEPSQLYRSDDSAPDASRRHYSNL